MKRTFLPMKDYPLYNDMVDRLITSSTILNGEPEIPNIHSRFWHKHEIQYAIQELEGDETGYYQHSGQRIQAYIPMVKSKLDDVKKIFANYKKSRVSLGYNEPTLMPKEMMDRFYELHARLTVYQTEAEFLNKRLDNYVDVEDKESDEMVLVHGLSCFSKLREGVLHTIDSQRVKEIDGIMVIVDERSPYNGMSVPDYRELAKKWQVDLKEADKQKLLRLQEEAKEKGNIIPTQLPARAPRKVSRGSLPSFPSGTRNYLKEDKPETKRIRKTA